MMSIIFSLWPRACHFCTSTAIVSMHRPICLTRTWDIIIQDVYSEKTMHHACLVSVICRLLLGPFHGAIAVPSVTRCRCRRCRWRHGHRCAGGARQYRWRHLVNGREAAHSSEWAQHFSNASCSHNHQHQHSPYNHYRFGRKFGEIHTTRWLSWHSDFAKFNFGRGSAL